MAAGIAIGFVAPGPPRQLGVVSNIFLRLIKSIIAPLLFGTLVAGIASTGSVKAMGRIGVKAILYFEIVTTIALFLGLAAVNSGPPGEGDEAECVRVGTGGPKAQTGLSAILEHTFPSSIIDAMAGARCLQIVVFSFLFGAAAASLGAAAGPVVGFAESLAEIMFRVHEVRHVSSLRSVRCGHGRYRFHQRHRSFVRARQADRDHVRSADSVCRGCARGCHRHQPCSRSAFPSGRQRTVLIAFSTASSEAALPRALETWSVSASRNTSSAS